VNLAGADLCSQPGGCPPRHLPQFSSHVTLIGKSRHVRNVGQACRTRESRDGPVESEAAEEGFRCHIPAEAQSTLESPGRNAGPPGPVVDSTDAGRPAGNRHDLAGSAEALTDEAARGFCFFAQELDCPLGREGVIGSPGASQQRSQRGAGIVEPIGGVRRQSAHDAKHTDFESEANRAPAEERGLDSALSPGEHDDVPDVVSRFLRTACDKQQVDATAGEEERWKGSLVDDDGVGEHGRDRSLMICVPRGRIRRGVEPWESVRPWCRFHGTMIARECAPYRELVTREGRLRA
jgi:hypothetical protein